MKVEVTLSIGFPQAIRKTVLEFHDDEDITDDDIMEAAHDWADTHINVDYEIISD